jgi:hypothetical protein
LPPPAPLLSRLCAHAGRPQDDHIKITDFGFARAKARSVSKLTDQARAPPCCRNRAAAGAIATAPIRKSWLSRATFKAPAL